MDEISRFSRRVAASIPPNRLTAAVDRQRALGADLVDLTVSNPTMVGITYPAELVSALSDERALRYEPDPFGLPSARAAVAETCARHGSRVLAEDVVLSASTSEAYSWLFKLLCDPGDEVLVPVPGYPLLEQLSRLEGVGLRAYPLEYHGVWSIDLEALEHAFTPRTKAVIVVTPNNPTGSYVRSGQWAELRERCAVRGVAIICDEVFIDYPVQPAGDAVQSVLSTLDQAGEGPLVVSLGGLSKSIGLPQHKLGWLVLHGPSGVVRASRERLEWICDSYLSVNTPVQTALPRLLASGAAVREAIRARVWRNLGALQERAERSPACGVLRVEGGWTAVMRVPAVRSEEALALDLLEEDHVLVHPGFFFDFASEAQVVVSLLPPPAVFDAGIDRVCRRADA